MQHDYYVHSMPTLIFLNRAFSILAGPPKILLSLKLRFNILRWWQLRRKPTAPLTYSKHITTIATAISGRCVDLTIVKGFVVYQR